MFLQGGTLRKGEQEYLSDKGWTIEDTFYLPESAKICLECKTPAIRCGGVCAKVIAAERKEKEANKRKLYLSVLADLEAGMPWTDVARRNGGVSDVFIRKVARENGIKTDFEKRMLAIRADVLSGRYTPTDISMKYAITHEQARRMFHSLGVEWVHGKPGRKSKACPRG